MQKRISFFDIFYKITITSALLITGTVLVLSIVALFSFNHKNPNIYYDENIEIHNQLDVNEFNAYKKQKDLFIIVSFKTFKEDEYILNYAYYYYNKYKCPTYLEADNTRDIKYVTITLEGIAAIS